MSKKQRSDIGYEKRHPLHLLTLNNVATMKKQSTFNSEYPHCRWAIKQLSRRRFDSTEEPDSFGRDAQAR